ncbi:hypothetical protein C7M84_007745 [Penaeus vannamei]|uniref:Uncharacterized protein n=1 Tax=Penaeus vannamei TaxID=6689 RepID=A0A423UAN2_PENVA|nr:hypothetical protein C7M84_007745 [Penaeus vannamei]
MLSPGRYQGFIAQGREGGRRERKGGRGGRRGGEGGRGKEKGRRRERGGGREKEGRERGKEGGEGKGRGRRKEGGGEGGWRGEEGEEGEDGGGGEEGRREEGEERRRRRRRRMGREGERERKGRGVWWEKGRKGKRGGGRRREREGRKVKRRGRKVGFPWSVPVLRRPSVASRGRGNGRETPAFAREAPSALVPTRDGGGTCCRRALGPRSSSGGEGTRRRWSAERPRARRPPLRGRVRARSDLVRGRPLAQANPCPEVTDLTCRLPLPTLIYRPEAEHLGDLLRSKAVCVLSTSTPQGSLSFRPGAFDEQSEKRIAAPRTMPPPPSSSAGGSARDTKRLFARCSTANRWRSQQRGLLPTDHNLTYGCYGQRPPLKVNELGGLSSLKKEKKALPRATAGVGERVRLLPSTHTGLRTTGSKEIQRGLPARPRTLFCFFFSQSSPGSRGGGSQSSNPSTDPTTTSREEAGGDSFPRRQIAARGGERKGYPRGRDRPSDGQAKTPEEAAAAKKQPPPPSPPLPLPQSKSLAAAAARGRGGRARAASTQATGRRQNNIRLQTPQKNATRNGALAATRAARLGSGGKQASTNGSRQEASEPSPWQGGGEVLSLAQSPFQSASPVGSAGGGAWDCRGFLPFSPTTADTGGGGTGTGYPGGPRSASWREPATFAVPGSGGREIREGTDAELTKSTGRSPTPKTPHTPGLVGRRGRGFLTASAPAREGAGGRRAQAPARGARPTSRGPPHRPRKAPTASSTRGSPPAARSRNGPPIVVGAGPQPPRPRPGPALGRPPGKNGPFGGRSRQGRARPLRRRPRPARAQGAEGGKPEPAPVRGRQTGQTDRQVQPPARRPRPERARGTKGKGEGPKPPNGEWAGRHPRPERGPGADGGKPEPTPVLRKTRQARPGPAALGPNGAAERARGGRRGREKPKPSPGQPRKTWLAGQPQEAPPPPQPP